MGHKPFLVIADRLARRGIASLRHDDRGAGKSEGSTPFSTITDFTQDADAGITILANRPEINPAAIGIMGHSEGRLVGAKLAVTSSEVSFLVLLAAPGMTLGKAKGSIHSP